jgi:hypothetical protein
MRGKPKINQAVVIKHAEDPVVMHIENIKGNECSCVWHGKDGAPYRSNYHADILESYKGAKQTRDE